MPLCVLPPFAECFGKSKDFSPFSGGSPGIFRENTGADPNKVFDFFVNFFYYYSVHLPKEDGCAFFHAALSRNAIYTHRELFGPGRTEEWPMKKKKKVGGLTKIAVAVFAAYATFTMVSLQLQISQKKEEKTQLEQQVEEQQLRNAETEALLESQDSDQYVARIARDQLGYVSPGERVFVDIASK